MALNFRIQRLEKKVTESEGQSWAVFGIRYYENPQEKAEARGRMISSYKHARRCSPVRYIFINQIPGPSLLKENEGLICSFIAQQ